MAGSVEKLLELLEIEQLDVDLFRGAQPETERQRVFGGQVAAQALVAACRSADAGFDLHSLHSYFLRPGDHLVPIIYRVERIRDGRSFETRRVVAMQHGREIYSQTCNFQKPEEGFEHSDLPPAVGKPEEGLSLADLAAARSEEELRHWQQEWAGLDIRHMGMSGRGLEVDPARPAQARLWVRVDGVLPDDQVLPEALKMAKLIAAMPPLAVMQIKEVVLAGVDASLETALMLERKANQLLFATQDQKEGMQAFIEKRKPVFKGC